MAVSYIGFGSNVGDREKNITRALAYLAANESNQIVKISGLYETQPVGYLDQADFLNNVLLYLVFLLLGGGICLDNRTLF